MFRKKDPMERWRRRNRFAADFADHTGWKVDVDAGVHTRLGGHLVNVLITAPLDPSNAAGLLVILEAGRQAERSHANQIGDDGGQPIEFEGWRGQAAPGSGLLQGDVAGANEADWDQIVRVAEFLVARI